MSQTKNNLIDTLNDYKVETINFDSPLKAEQKRQSNIKANQVCRHLKGLDTVTHIDHEADEAITLIHCSLCGVEMTDEMMKQRKETLKIFNKR
jgi:flagellar basal body rod protein FlgB